jgi:hypothetical protein
MFYGKLSRLTMEKLRLGSTSMSLAILAYPCFMGKRATEKNTRNLLMLEAQMPY